MADVVVELNCDRMVRARYPQTTERFVAGWATD